MSGSSENINSKLMDMEQRFIETERERQKNLYTNRYGEDTDFSRAFYNDGKPPKFHIDDLDELGRLENALEAIPEDTELGQEARSSGEKAFNHLEHLANMRHQNEFMKQMITNYDEFIEFADQKNELNREETKETLIQLEKYQKEYMEEYKNSITLSVDKIVSTAPDLGYFKLEEPNYEIVDSNIKNKQESERSDLFKTLLQEQKTLDKGLHIDEEIASDVDIEIESSDKKQPVREEVSLSDLNPVAARPAYKNSILKSIMFYTTTDLWRDICKLGNAIFGYFASPTPEVVLTEMEKMDKLTELQKPYTQAVDKAKTAQDYNYTLLDTMEFIDDSGNKRTVTGDELKREMDKMTDTYIDAFRPNARYGMYGMYMLSQGMTLDEVASDDPKYDAQKKQLAGEFHKMAMVGANAFAEAEKEGRKRGESEFDQKLDREDFTEKFKSKMKPEELAGMDEDKLKTTIDKAIDRARFDAGLKEGYSARKEVLRTSPDVKKFYETYLAGGVALCNQKIPVTSVLNVKEAAENYAKLNLLNNMTLNYSDMFYKLGDRLGIDNGYGIGLDSKTVQKTINTDKIIERCVNGALQPVDYVVTDRFVGKVGVNAPNDYGKFMMSKSTELMSPVLDSVIKGKERFSDIPNEIGETIMAKTNKTTEKLLEFIEKIDKNTELGDNLKMVKPLEPTLGIQGMASNNPQPERGRGL